MISKLLTVHKTKVAKSQLLMVKSRNNTPASWIIILGLALFLFMIMISLYSICFNVTIIRYNAKKEINPATLDLWIGIVGLAVFLFVASVNMTLFIIDSEKGKIIIKNFVSRQTKEYFFSELDGYCDMATKHSMKSSSSYFKALGFVKNKKIIFIIDSYYCSNLTEVRDAVAETTYLGIDESWKLLKRQ